MSARIRFFSITLRDGVSNFRDIVHLNESSHFICLMRTQKDKDGLNFV